MSSETKRSRLIAALLTSRSVADAAKKADVSVRTAMRWRADPNFQAGYNAERARLLEVVTNRLVNHGTDFEEVLHSVAMDPQAPPASRSSAASRGLEALSRFVDANREQRLCAVERALATLKQRRNRRRS